jgi:hypothetical protein
LARVFVTLGSILALLVAVYFVIPDVLTSARSFLDRQIGTVPDDSVRTPATDDSVRTPPTDDSVRTPPTDDSVRTPATDDSVPTSGAGGSRTVAGHGYEFSVVAITRTRGSWGPNAGQPALRITASVLRTVATDYHSMRLTVIDDSTRQLAVEPFTESGTLDPPLNQRVQYEVVLLEEGNGATALDSRCTTSIGRIPER